MYTTEIDKALELAKKTGELQLKAREHRIAFEKKTDSSPVTAVDTACEELLRQNLLDTFPDDSFLGEESGLVAGNSGRCWIIDPIDGTRPFIRGIPTYSTLIALEVDHVPVVGVIHLPELKITCWAGMGEGAFCNGNPIRVSATTELKNAMGSALGFIEHENSVLREKLLAFMRTWDYAYGFMDAYSYVCLASGKLDLCINLLDKPWDCAAAACIVTEAGGTFSDLSGIASVHNGAIVLSNGLLHPRILDYFRC
jgi:histidinol-phosphatase